MTKLNPRNFLICGRDCATPYVISLSQGQQAGQILAWETQDERDLNTQLPLEGHGAVEAGQTENYPYDFQSTCISVNSNDSHRELDDDSVTYSVAGHRMQRSWTSWLVGITYCWDTCRNLPRYATGAWQSTWGGALMRRPFATKRPVLVIAAHASLFRITYSGARHSKMNCQNCGPGGDGCEE